jgi:isoprenylcysteine carboxyl methyltransferase (ICMT) family protein YpbQ
MILSQNYQTTQSSITILKIAVNVLNIHSFITIASHIVFYFGPVIDFNFLYNRLSWVGTIPPLQLMTEITLFQWLYVSKLKASDWGQTLLMDPAEQKPFPPYTWWREQIQVLKFSTWKKNSKATDNWHCCK